jgi:hypothetical protein
MQTVDEIEAEMRASLYAEAGTILYAEVGAEQRAGVVNDMQAFLFGRLLRLAATREHNLRIASEALKTTHALPTLDGATDAELFAEFERRGYFVNNGEISQ